MQKNSAPNSAPASRPPVRVPSRANSAMPRRPRPEPDQDRGAGRAQRRLPERRNLGQRRLRGDLVQAPEKAAEDEEDDGDDVEMGDGAGGCQRHPSSAISAGSLPPRFAPLPPRGRGGLLRSPFSLRRASARRAIASTSSAAITPATRPLAWANGAVAMSQPAGWRSAGPHGASLATLIASAPSRRAPIARRGPRACRTRCTGHARGAGVEHAREAAVVEQVGSGEQADLRQRPGEQPRDGDRCRHAREPAERADEQRAGQVGEQVQRAVVDEHRRERAPGLAQGQPRLPVEWRPVRGRTRAPRRRRGRRRARTRRGRRQAKTARQRARTALLCPASDAGSTCVGCSSRRARCWARRRSR